MSQALGAPQSTAAPDMPTWVRMRGWQGRLQRLDGGHDRYGRGEVTRMACGGGHTGEVATPCSRRPAAWRHCSSAPCACCLCMSTSAVAAAAPPTSTDLESVLTHACENSATALSRGGVAAARPPRPCSASARPGRLSPAATPSPLHVPRQPWWRRLAEVALSHAVAGATAA